VLSEQSEEDVSTTVEVGNYSKISIPSILSTMRWYRK